MCKFRKKKILWVSDTIYIINEKGVKRPFYTLLEELNTSGFPLIF